MTTRNRALKIIILIVVCLLVGVAGLAGYRYFLKPEITPQPPPAPKVFRPLIPLYDFPRFPVGTHTLAYHVYRLGLLFGDIKYLKVEFTLRETVFELGQEVDFEPWIINTGNRTVTIDHHLIQVVLEDEERGLKWIPGGGRGFPAARRAKLGPGEVYFCTWDWGRIILREGLLWTGEAPPYALEPGRYTLHVYAHFRSTVDGVLHAFRIYAPSIQIEIKE